MESAQEEEQPAGRGAGLVTIVFYLGKASGGRAAHWDLSTFFQVTRRRRCFFAIVSYPHHILLPLLAACFVSLAYLSTSRHVPIRSCHCDTTGLTSGDSVC